jgi:hypothetical protein
VVNHLTLDYLLKVVVQAVTLLLVQQELLELVLEAQVAQLQLQLLLVLLALHLDTQLAELVALL